MAEDGGVHDDVAESSTNYGEQVMQEVDCGPEHVRHPEWHRSQYGNPPVVWAR